MSQVLEIEFKNLLTKEEFHRLLTAFKLQEDDFTLQHNHYLDTAAFHLKEAGCALRVREKSGRFELTLKQPAAEGLLETNQRLLQEQAQALLTTGRLPEGTVRNSIYSLVAAREDFCHFGTLSTKRAEITYKDGLLVFDHSFYFQREDFELEYEVTEKSSGEKHFKKLLNDYQIPVRKTDNKVSRFYQEKLRLIKGEKQGENHA
ncbi:CYTH domain-containing protein [Bacillus xiapuensis]|uniref:CYTH domain-containing protein n=1 Tax=Bacillus xiapuensis TaxID=2014075 RepID=UPI000C247B49|nr:CYTH domain-containing protein [Bacillus xiapuensis]